MFEIEAFTLTSALYELLANPPILKKLKDELLGAVSNPGDIPPFSELDGLPYFDAVINEVIRLHPGVMNRQYRTSPEVPIVYTDKKRGAEYVLPPNTVYCMSPLAIHMNPDVFENPYKFEPQRWIDNPKLARAFMGFSKGTRGCVG